MRCFMGKAAVRGHLRGAVPVVACALILLGGPVLGCHGRHHSDASDESPGGHQQAKGAETGGGGHKNAAGGARDRGASGPSARQVQIAWISDDYPAALARAKKEHKPIFIDMWAPWCHTCLSMQQAVLVDASLEPYLDRFVWLALDTDKAKNAPVLRTLHIEVWPTFYVISPEGEEIEARHLGGASISQLRELLDRGEQGHKDALAKAGKLDPTSPDGLVRAGDRAAAAGKLAEADRAYGAALAKAPADWPRAPSVLVKQIEARATAGDGAGCADLGMGQGQRAALGKSNAVTDFADMADSCASALDEPRARLLRGRLGEAIRGVLAAPDAALSTDDRADALRVLRQLADELGDPDSAHGYAVRERDLLDRAAAEAPTAWARSTYSWPRVEVYIYLHQADKLVPDLKKSVADLPKEYDPPYRLAEVYQAMGKNDEALAMAEKAASLAYGPRKVRILMLVADLQKARGDDKAERAARKAVIDDYNSLPQGQRDPRLLAKARAQLAAVGKPDKKK